MDIVDKALQDDVVDPDVVSIMIQLQSVIDAVVAPAVESEIYDIDFAVRPIREADDHAPGPYDISKIDFERLRQEFAKRSTKHTDVQSLEAAIDQRVQWLIAENPGRTDYQQRFQEIIYVYNCENDRPTIEATCEALLRLADLDNEARRVVRGAERRTLGRVRHAGGWQGTDQG